VARQLFAALCTYFRVFRAGLAGKSGATSSADLRSAGNSTGASERIRLPQPPMALACVGAIPSDPLGVDIDFVRRHCKAEWASALTSVTVKPLDANGGGLTGATISKLHCSYDPPGAGPATLILKLSDETAMREYKASGQGALGGAGRSGRDRPFSRGALIERHMNWGFGLTEHDMSLNEALFYGQWREQLVSGGCRAPEIYAVCVSIDGLPETEDGAPLPGVALRQMRLQPPRETAPVLLARRRHPNYVPFVLGNQSTGLVTAVIMEVRKRHFLSTVYAKNAHFTKTGSGQT